MTFLPIGAQGLLLISAQGHSQQCSENHGWQGLNPDVFYLRVFHLLFQRVFLSGRVGVPPMQSVLRCPEVPSSNQGT